MGFSLLSRNERALILVFALALAFGVGGLYYSFTITGKIHAEYPQVLEQNSADGGFIGFSTAAAARGFAFAQTFVAIGESLEEIEFKLGRRPEFVTSVNITVWSTSGDVPDTLLDLSAIIPSDDIFVSKTGTTDFLRFNLQGTAKLTVGQKYAVVVNVTLSDGGDIAESIWWATGSDDPYPDGELLGFDGEKWTTQLDKDAYFKLIFRDLPAGVIEVSQTDFITDFAIPVPFPEGEGQPPIDLVGQTFEAPHEDLNSIALRVGKYSGFLAALGLEIRIWNAGEEGLPTEPTDLVAVIPSTDVPTFSTTSETAEVIAHFNGFDKLIPGKNYTFVVDSFGPLAESQFVGVGIFSGPSDAYPPGEFVARLDADLPPFTAGTWLPASQIPGAPPNLDFFFRLFFGLPPDTPTDSDGDGVFDFVDNCDNIANADQADLNSDGIGDACQPELFIIVNKTAKIKLAQAVDPNNPSVEEAITLTGTETIFKGALIQEYSGFLQQLQIAAMDLSGRSANFGIVNISKNPAVASSGGNENTSTPARSFLNIAPSGIFVDTDLGTFVNDYEIALQGFLHDIIDFPPGNLCYKHLGGAVALQQLDGPGGEPLWITEYWNCIVDEKPRPNITSVKGRFPSSSVENYTSLAGLHLYSTFLSGALDHLVTAKGSVAVNQSDPTTVQEYDKFLNQIETEIVAMSLTGSHPLLGEVKITNMTSSPSTGLIRGQLDSEGPPSVDFPAASFFDVFFEISIGGGTLFTPFGERLHFPSMLLRNTDPVQLRASIFDKPWTPICHQLEGPPIEFFDVSTNGDPDGDDVPNSMDNCDDVFNPGQEDLDSDGGGDVCDGSTGDPDGDDVPNEADNCDNIANADQTDADGDGVGDACELSVTLKQLIWCPLKARGVVGKPNGTAIKIDGTTATTDLTGTKAVTIEDEVTAEPIVEFEWDFDEESLDLEEVAIDKGTTDDGRGFVIVKNLTLQVGQTKSVRVTKVLGSGFVCVKDVPGIASVEEISSGCDAVDETRVPCPGTADSFNCTDEVENYLITGLENTGISETLPPPAPPAPAVPEAAAAAPPAVAGPPPVSEAKVVDPALPLTEVKITAPLRVRATVSKITPDTVAPIIAKLEQAGRGIYLEPFDIAPDISVPLTAQIELAFKVQKAFVLEQAISRVDIELWKYVGGERWEEVPTEIVSEDAEYIYYVGRPTGLSLYAVTYPKAAVVPILPAVCGNAICEPTEDELSCPADCAPAVAPALPAVPGLTVLGGIAAAAAAGAFAVLVATGRITLRRPRILIRRRLPPEKVKVTAEVPAKVTIKPVPPKIAIPEEIVPARPYICPGCFERFSSREELAAHEHGHMRRRAKMKSPEQL